MNMPRLALSAALAALVAGPALAQQTPPAPPAPVTAPVTAPAQAPASESLPALLQELGMTQTERETRGNGRLKIEGRLPDGTEIEVEFEPDGALREVEADDGVLPERLVLAALPEGLRGHPSLAMLIGVEEIRIRPRHVEVSGRREGGGEIDLRFDAANRLAGVDVDDGALPAALVEQLLPQAVRGSEVFSQFAQIERLRSGDGGFELRGRDAAGAQIRSRFDEAGAVMRFGREGARGLEMREGGPRGPKEARDQARGPGPRDGARPQGGPRADRGRDGPGRAGPGWGGPAGRAEQAGRGQMPAPRFDPVAVNQRLSDAGYGSFGFLRPAGPRVLLDATNPQGEAVTLELDPAGEVVRETAR